MSGTYIIRNATLINEGTQQVVDILIRKFRFEKIASQIDTGALAATEINAEEYWALPGIIDDQVHFREPGLTHKGDLYTEPRAAVAGGITTYMEMPNTQPPATTQALLEEKYAIAAHKSLANYSFYMGTTNDNAEEVLRINYKDVCGIKIFMGSSTGSMLVEDENTLKKIFSESPVIIAIHSENDHIIKDNLEKIKAKYQGRLTPEMHPEIRNEKACFQMTEYAVSMAKKFGTRLHVLHLSTADELHFFTNQIPLEEKKITSEVCIHHLWFTAADYKEKGNWIKWNPAIKAKRHQDELWKALLDDRIDIIATDHAPHSLEEKTQEYSKAPSGGPLVQHSLNAMIHFYQNGRISLHKIVEKMCHSPAKLFQIQDRGYLREGYYADLVLFDPKKSFTVEKPNILYKCGWSPFEGQSFIGQVAYTFVSGHLAYKLGMFDEEKMGHRLVFQR